MPYTKESLIGQKFGKLTVIGEGVRSPSGRRQWRCICECGGETSCITNNLRRGNSKSCGCETNSKDIAGQRFGRLIAISPDGKSSSRQIRWKCQCDCGNISTVDGTQLRRGTTNSCGCLSREKTAEQGHKNSTHGHTRKGVKSPLYLCWRNMHVRCTNKKSKDWVSGITC